LNVENLFVFQGNPGPDGNAGGQGPPGPPGFSVSFGVELKEFWLKNSFMQHTLVQPVKYIAREISKPSCQSIFFLVEIN
jgi:hypothetical protein